MSTRGWCNRQVGNHPNIVIIYGWWEAVFLLAIAVVLYPALGYCKCGDVSHSP